MLIRGKYQPGLLVIEVPVPRQNTLSNLMQQQMNECVINKASTVCVPHNVLITSVTVVSCCPQPLTTSEVTLEAEWGVSQDQWGWMVEGTELLRAGIILIDLFSELCTSVQYYLQY